MTLDEVPANVPMILTTDLQRLFHVAGCNPACHSCRTLLTIGQSFTLVSLDGTDEMIGSCCTMEQLRAAKEERARSSLQKARARQKALDEHDTYRTRHPGYSRPSRMVAL